VHELQADMAMNIMELCGILQWKERAEEWLCVLLANVMCLDVPLPEMGEDEEAMLSEAFYVKSNSRLGCQIPITKILEGWN
jgi:2Fe-2S ferredoxin